MTAARDEECFDVEEESPMDDDSCLPGDAFCAELIEAVMVGGEWLEPKGRIRFGPYHLFAAHRDLPGSEVEQGFWFELRSGQVVFGPASTIQAYRMQGRL